MLELHCSALNPFMGKSHGAPGTETVSFHQAQRLCLGFAAVELSVGQDYHKWVPSLP